MFEKAEVLINDQTFIFNPRLVAIYKLIFIGSELKLIRFVLRLVRARALNFRSR